MDDEAKWVLPEEEEEEEEEAGEGTGDWTAQERHSLATERRHCIAYDGPPQNKQTNKTKQNIHSFTA